MNARSVILALSCAVNVMLYSKIQVSGRQYHAAQLIGEVRKGKHWHGFVCEVFDFNVSVANNPSQQNCKYAKMSNDILLNCP